jgi:hypothetical protein
MSKVNKYKEPEEVKDRFITDDCDPFSIKDGKAAIEKALSVIGDKRFSRIIQLRYMGDDVASWKEVGAKMGYSHELVRGIYLNNFNEFKKIVEKEMGGV